MGARGFEPLTSSASRMCRRHDSQRLSWWKHYSPMLPDGYTLGTASAVPSPLDSVDPLGEGPGRDAEGTGTR